MATSRAPRRDRTRIEVLVDLPHLGRARARTERAEMISRAIIDAVRKIEQNSSVLEHHHTTIPEELYA